MSEFWKKRRPKLSEDEERALWERVRTMPSEAGGAARHAGRRSPWAALWARPAVRFGAPVLAVALVAIVWVAQQAPEAPRPEMTSQASRPEAMSEAPRPEAMTGPADQAAPAPAPGVGQDERARVAASGIASEEAKDAASPRERENLASGAAPRQAKETPAAGPAFAPPPAAPPSAADDAPAPTKVTVIQGKTETQASGGRAERQRSADPRVAAIRRGDYVSRMFEEVVRPSSPGAFGVVVELPLSPAAIHLSRDERGRWKVVDDPFMLEGSLPQPGPLERRAGLAAELLRAAEAKDRSGIDRVQAAALALQREQPADEGARALVAWATAAWVAVQEP